MKPMNSNNGVQKAHSPELGFEHRHELDSTNAELARRISAGKLASPLCLSADIQTRGRGRRGRVWLNTEGALMMSICFPAAWASGEELPLISPAAALGVHDAVSAYLPRCAIKWPNDIVSVSAPAALHGGALETAQERASSAYSEVKKLCGILCELVAAPTGEAFAVIGIGINANCTALPSGLLQPATSLELELGRRVDIEELKRQTALAVMGRLEELKMCPEAVLSEYSRRCFTLGKSVAAFALSGEKTAEGTAKRIESDGRLVIETPRGEVFVSAADVSVRANEPSEKREKHNNE